MADDSKRAWAVNKLQDKAQQLGRIPKKDDFDELDRSRIKAFLGPWPRALEAASLKEARKVSGEKKKRTKKQNQTK